MKLKHLSKIETTIRMIIIIIAIPFAIVCRIFDMIKYPFSWVVKEFAIFSEWVGNKLLRCSDEVKDGTIKNQDCIRKYTASFVWELLRQKN
jgi:hypothetical protein